MEIAIAVPTEAALLRATEHAFTDIGEIHRAMSFHDAGSDVRRLARAPAGTCLQLNPHTWQVLRLALDLEALSGGVFNVAVAPALVAAGLLPVPDDAPWPHARCLAEGIELLEGNRLRAVSSVWVDLGGIAKGYAVDCTVCLLQTMGVACGLVNAGGDMRAFGTGEHPVHLRFAHGLKVVALLHNGALASSCNLGARSPHIDPHRGVAVQAKDSIVVQAPSAAVADALTKVAMLAPAIANCLCPGLRAQWRAFDHSAL